jgi:plastocyanin
MGVLNGMRRRTLVFLLAATCLSWTPAPMATGVVAGMVTLVEPAASERPDVGRYARRRAVPPPKAARTGGVGDVVVYLMPETVTRSSAAGEAPRVVQRGRTIVPFLTVARVGQRVDFPNQDDVFHNLFSLSEPNRFDLGRYAPGETRSHVFDEAGSVRLFCDIHSEMAGVILVLDTPYHARPDGNGAFRIEGVPAGRYTAVAWHDRTGADTVRVVIEDGATARADFSLGT